jgi:HK97 family phage major capsid protein
VARVRLLPEGTAGQSFAPLTVEPSVTEYLYKFCVIRQAGYTLLSGLKGNLSLPRQTTANQATWAAENAQIARTAGAYDQVAISPNRVGTVTAYSNQLLAQSTLDVHNVVLDDILRTQAVAIDAAALYGSGPANNQPTGLLTQTANPAGGP